MTTASRFGQVATSTARTVQEPASATMSRRPAKYTLLMDAATAAALKEDEARLVRVAGSAPKRSEIFRILLELLHEDQSLFDEVARRYVASPEAARRAGTTG